MELHIPEGINYECTACGKCCGGWSVPMTEDDYDRIARVNWADHLNRYTGKNLFRPLKPYEAQGTPYAYAIREGSDGHCPFLVDNLCLIHNKFGAKAKPSICQLFPYCFNETPSGVYATVSFISMGVVHNSGAALNKQKDHLEKKYAEFRKLFPDHHPNWSKLEITIGKPITWDEYLSIEQKLLQFLQERDLPLEERFLKGSNYLMSIVGIAMAKGTTNGTSGKQRLNQSTVGATVAQAEEESDKASTRGTANNKVRCGKESSSTELKFLDRNLMITLYNIYFPARPLGRGEGNFKVLRFFFQLAFGNIFPGLKISGPGRSFSIEELKDRNFPQNDKEIEDLIYRYFYSRLFGKLYFGAGFGQLTLITGFHHLAVLYALIKLNAEALSITRGAPQVSYVDVVASVRQLEKRWGETQLDGYAAAVLETLMFSAGRVKRILYNS